MRLLQRIAFRRGRTRGVLKLASRRRQRLLIQLQLQTNHRELLLRVLERHGRLAYVAHVHRVHVEVSRLQLRLQLSHLGLQLQQRGGHDGGAIRVGVAAMQVMHASVRKHS
jgi:hypothetical protein